MADANLDIRVTSKGIKEAHLALQKLGISADKAEEAVKQYKEETKRNTATQKQYETQQKKTTSAVSQAAKVHKEARGGFRAMRGATQQLSFQLQDVAVQAQSGTAGLTILAQQGPQILSIFGPGGAIAGAFIAFGALIAGTLLPGLTDTEEKVDDLGEALDRLKAATDRTKGGVLALSEEFATLAKESSALAELEIELDISKTKRGLEQSIKDIEEALDFDIIGKGDLFRGFEETIENFSNGLGRGAKVSIAFQGRIREAGQAMGITGRQFNDLALALADFEASRTPELFNELQETVQRLRDTSSDTAAYDKFAEVFVDQARNVRLATSALQDLEKVQTMIQEGELETVASLEEGEKARRDLAARAKAELDKYAELVKRNRASMFDALDEELNKTERIEREKAALAEQTQQTLSKLYSETSPAVLSFARQQQAMLKILERSNEQGLLSEEGFIDAKKKLHEDFVAFVDAQEQEKERKEAERQARALEREAQLAYDRMSLVEKWMLSTKQAIENIDALQMLMAVNFERSLANAFNGILTGTMTVKEAFVQFTKDMLSSFLGMISEMIAKRLALAAVEKLIGKTTAAASATYLGLTAQAQSMMAGLNAFASTAAIPVVGPAAAPAAMATAIGVTAPIAGAISALSGAAAAARATGGQVRGGQSYLVGERGPELLTMGGSGRISSNDQLKQAVGGGGGITIINNVDARGADASVDQKIRVAMKQTSEATTRNIQNLMKRRRFV
jgi:hypothetical protein